MDYKFIKFNDKNKVTINILDIFMFNTFDQGNLKLWIVLKNGTDIVLSYNYIDDYLRDTEFIESITSRR